jgi:hypothetical protein
MDKISYNQYQSLVRNRAWKRFKSEHPLFDLISPLVVGLVVGIIESFRLAKKIEPVTTAFVTAFVTSLVYGILYIWYFSREHVSIFNENKKRINEAQPDDPFEFSVVEPPYHPNLNYVYAGIDVINKSAYQVQCFVNVQTKTKLRREDLLGYEVYPQGAHFEIPGKATRRFSFAQAGIDQPTAYLNTLSEDSKLIQRGKHEMRIFIAGIDSKGKEVEHVEDFVLTYEGADKLELRKVYAEGSQRLET